MGPIIITNPSTGKIENVSESNKECYLPFNAKDLECINFLSTRTNQCLKIISYECPF